MFYEFFREVIESQVVNGFAEICSGNRMTHFEIVKTILEEINLAYLLKQGTLLNLVVYIHELSHRRRPSPLLIVDKARSN